MITLITIFGSLLTLSLLFLLFVVVMIVISHIEGPSYYEFIFDTNKTRKRCIELDRQLAKQREKIDYFVFLGKYLASEEDKDNG